MLSRANILKRVKELALALFALVLACGLCSCKPTDFFTEIIITPFSDVVDENNPEKNVVNSPDATEESKTLAALEWAQESERSEAVQSLVVYSSSPIVQLTTHHTIYDLNPLLTSVEASNGVQLVHNPEAELDASANGGTQQPQESEAQATGETDQTSEDAPLQPDTQASPDAPATSGVVRQDLSNVGGNTSNGNSGTGSNTNQANGDASGNNSQGDDGGQNSGEGESENDNPGPQPDPSGGYGGSVNVYNPGDAFQAVPKADSLGVIGDDLATLVQAIGGSGSVAALTESAYYGYEPRTTAGCFRDVFGGTGEIDVYDYDANRVLWHNSGSNPEDLKSVEALVNACGQDGVIFYDQRVGDQYSLFTDAQREALFNANITLVPVELSSVQGLLDAAAAVGDSLEGSATAANDSQAMAKTYREAVSSITKGSADAHGGGLASANGGLTFTKLSAYNSCPVYTSVYTRVFAYVATDYETGISSSSSVDPSDGLLFVRANPNNSPLFFWMQAAGVYSRAVGSNYDTSQQYKLLWPLRDQLWTGFTALKSGVYTTWLNSGKSYESNMEGAEDNAGSGQTNFGLGSEQVPYLVVSASPGYTSKDVKDAVVNSMYKGGNGAITPYAAWRYLGGSADAGSGNTPAPASNPQLFSTIGSTMGTTAESPFYTGLKLAATVRENPCGLLGNWTEGSMESVLEAVWLTDLYSHSATGCAYEPINSMENFQVTIGGIACTTTEEAVKAFYSTFYRVSEENLDAYFNAAVPDTFSDLN
ncbi:MAG: hypothetical protein Q4E12_06450 [Coriobacteriia bacterium]|nr:hypothetical protein [Coriobacteriia bacterium]